MILSIRVDNPVSAVTARIVSDATSAEIPASANNARVLSTFTDEEDCDDVTNPESFDNSETLVGIEGVLLKSVYEPDVATVAKLSPILAISFAKPASTPSALAISAVIADCKPASTPNARVVSAAIVDAEEEPIEEIAVDKLPSAPWNAVTISAKLSNATGSILLTILSILVDNAESCESTYDLNATGLPATSKTPALVVNAEEPKFNCCEAETVVEFRYCKLNITTVPTIASDNKILTELTSIISMFAITNL